MTTTTAFATWRTVAAAELRDLWAHGHGLLVLAAATLVTSTIVLTYAFSPELSVVAAAEGTLLVVRVGLGTSVVLGAAAAATSFSLMREQGTLETLLLTPLPRRDLVIGKLAAGASLALATTLAVVPYLVANRRPGAAVAQALLATAIVALPLVTLAVAGGMIASLRSNSSRAALGVVLAAVVVGLAPAVVPPPVADHPVPTVLAAIDPLAAAARFLDEVITGGAAVGAVAYWLIAPVTAAVAVTWWLWRASADVRLEVRR